MRYYTESEAAVVSGVSADTIRALARKALVEAQHLEGRWLLSEQAVEELLDLAEAEDEPGDEEEPAPCAALARRAA